jgi:hypothetical protein
MKRVIVAGVLALAFAVSGVLIPAAASADSGAATQGFEWGFEW